LACELVKILAKPRALLCIEQTSISGHEWIEQKMSNGQSKTYLTP
jgi:hypothetical protein